MGIIKTLISLVQSAPNPAPNIQPNGLEENFRRGMRLEDITFIDEKEARVVRDFPDILDAIQNSQSGHKEEALEKIKKLIPVYPDFVGAYIWAGDILIDLGRGKEADRVINEGLQKSAAKSPLYELRAELYAKGYQCPQNSLANFPKYFLNMFKAALAESTFPNKEDFWSSKMLGALYISQELYCPSEKLKVIWKKISNSQSVDIGKTTKTLVHSGRRELGEDLKQNITSWIHSLERAYETRHPEYFK